MDNDPWVERQPNALSGVFAAPPSASQASQKRFWSAEPGKLPLPPSGYLFPVAAFEMIGVAFWADHHWSGNEMRLADIPHRPLKPADEVFDEQEPSTAEVGQNLSAFVTARQLVAEVRKGFQPAVSSFSRGQWEEARVASAQEAHVWLAARKRRDAIVDFLSTKAANGELATVYRNVGGGREPNPVPQAWWSLDHPLQRFRACGLDPNKPSDLAAKPTAYLFFERRGLQALIDRLGTKPADSPIVAPPDAHYSPYLKLLIEVAQVSGIGPNPEQQIPVESLYCTIKDLASERGIDLKEREWKMMATFLREPGSKVGLRKLLADQRTGTE